MSTGLTPDRDAQGADVAAAVECPEGDGVFPGCELAKIQRKDFVPAVGDAVVRKDRHPRRAVEARIRLFYLPSRIVNGKNHPHRISRQLRLARYLDDGGVLSMSTGSLNRSPVSF